ncbi:MAG: hydrogenase subunit MbhD domain-containing protein [Candidatus Bipolaricaulota bacterium]|nr:hydrogenase subunit MbhD domain-containing protein [Candidatus Bipolaricaulota bacterium]
MISHVFLLLLLPLLAVFAITRRRRLTAVIGMGLFSLILAAVYLLLNAPDVAITEAAIGAALVTFLYILAIRKTGRLVVAGNETPGLLYREGDKVLGVEQEILNGFARHLGLELVVHFDPEETIEGALLQGEADIGAGGIFSKADERLLQSSGYLSTVLYGLSLHQARQPPRGTTRRRPSYFMDLVEEIKAGQCPRARLDLARFLSVSRLDLSAYRVERLPGSFSYFFIVSSEREELHGQLNSYVEGLKESGGLKKIVRRYFS